MWVLFSDNVDIEVGINLLLENFGSDIIVLLLFPSLGSCNKISTRPIYYIPDLLFLKYGLDKIGLLRPIFEVTEFFSLALVVIVFICHLKGSEKCSTSSAEHISDLITG